MVAVWRIVGYENRVTSDESFTEARKEFAEIPSGAATTVFFELQLTEAGRKDTAQLGQVEIRWVTACFWRIQSPTRDAVEHE